MNCIWCKNETTTDRGKPGFANAEHVIPECVGGKLVLPVGKVCQACNNSFSKVDQDLRHENSMMAKYYQDFHLETGDLLGKNRKSEEGRRRKARMTADITVSRGGSVERKDQGITTIFSNVHFFADGEAFNERFCRALHKCAINIVYKTSSFEDMTVNFGAAIEFVKLGSGDYRQWSYGMCYADPLDIAVFDPFGIVCSFGAAHIAVILFFPNVIAVVGLQPNLLTPKNLEIIGTKLCNQNDILHGHEEWFIERFSRGCIGSERSKFFGSLFPFSFKKQRLPAEQSGDGKLQLLCKCGVCGQINPVGITVNHQDVLGPTNNRRYSSMGGGWNPLREADLNRQGFDTSSWPKDFLATYLAQSFQYHLDNINILGNERIVKMMTCRNCEMELSYSNIDLFL